MHESRARNYLLYATGEILLVIVGILIALQPRRGAHAGHGVTLIATERGPNRLAFGAAPQSPAKSGNLAGCFPESAVDPKRTYRQTRGA